MRLIKINKSFLFALLGLISISILLEYYYFSFVCRNYADYGFVLDFDLLKYLESKVFFIVLIVGSIFINKRSSFISALFLFLLLLIYVPGHLIYSYSNGARSLFYSTITFFAILGFIAPLKINLLTLQIPNNIRYYSLVIFTLLLTLPIFFDFRLNINTKVLALSDIYEVRKVFKSNASFISSYTFWWLAKVILPVMLVYSLIKKDNKIVLLSLVILIYLFLISGHKSVYFTPILIFFYYHFGKDYNEKILLTMLFMLILFVVINIPDLYIERPLFKSIFVRRMFFVPALLNDYYFDFFKDNHIYLSHSIFSDFSNYPYDLQPAYLIGEEYFGKPEMSSNTGIVANGFMNFGYLGVVIYSVIFSLFLSILNSINMNRRYFGLFIFFMFIFRGSAFFTTILTHGFWLVLILAFVVFPKTETTK